MGPTPAHLWGCSLFVSQAWIPLDWATASPQPAPLAPACNLGQAVLANVLTGLISSWMPNSVPPVGAKSLVLQQNVVR